MKNNKLVEQLKSLKQTRAGGAPDERWLASTRETLLMQIKNTVGETQEQPTRLRSFTEAFRVFRPENLTRAVAVPAAILLMMVGASTGASALVSAAHSTLPGDALYGVKLFGEQASLRFAAGSAKTERRLEIAGRRLDEMARLAVGSDSLKGEKLSAVSDRFSAQMMDVREDLAELQGSEDAESVVLLALKVDAKADEYQKLFNKGAFPNVPTLRLALLSLDQVSIQALELLVEKQSKAPGVLPEAQLTANVEQSINTFASRVASTEGSLGGDASVPESRILLTEKARTAVEEAKELFSQGDFKAAVKKVIEGTELVTEAESAEPTTEESAPEPAEEEADEPEIEEPENAVEADPELIPENESQE